MSETKLTPQILAMYLGCRIQFRKTSVGTFVGYSGDSGGFVEVDMDGTGLYVSHHRVNEVKPILRRLEDMTEEEAIECGVSGAWCDLEFDGTWRSNQFTTKAFIGLLSKSFDLFGLIDAGLAIDAKTLKP